MHVAAAELRAWRYRTSESNKCCCRDASIRGESKVAQHFSEAQGPSQSRGIVGPERCKFARQYVAVNNMSCSARSNGEQLCSRI